MTQTRKRPPAHLSPRAAALWRAILAEHPAGHFGGSEPILGAYCLACERAEQAAQAATATPPVVEYRGRFVRSPESAEFTRAVREMLLLGTKLHLFPQQRIGPRKAAGMLAGKGGTGRGVARPWGAQ